jgi:hypothetical protein
MPRKHPEDRADIVISGVFYIALGDEFDASKLEAYPPGALIILAGNMPHFRWAKSGEYVAQITAMGQTPRRGVDSGVIEETARFDESGTPIPLKRLASCQIGGSR